MVSMSGNICNYLGLSLCLVVGNSIQYGRRAAAHDICVAEDGFDRAGGAPDGSLQLSALTPVGQPQSAAPLRRPIKNVQRRARLRQRRQAMLQAPYCALPAPTYIQLSPGGSH